MVRAWGDIELLHDKRQKIDVSGLKPARIKIKGCRELRPAYMWPAYRFESCSTWGKPHEKRNYAREVAVTKSELRKARKLALLRGEKLIGVLAIPHNAVGSKRTKRRAASRKRAALRKQLTGEK